MSENNYNIDAETQVYIKKTLGNSIESITKNLSFETNENIETSIDQIVETIKYFDEKYTETIDKVMNK